MIIAYGISAKSAELGPLVIVRRAVGPKDVAIDITHCGICHTDLHEVRGETGWTKYPLVPGHEIVGRVTSVGAGVTRFSVGDAVGVGCMVDSCRKCSCCLAGLEQFCEADATYTYGGVVDEAPGHTLGGYSERIVVDEDFVLKIRHGNNQLATTAPLLCAGITMYSPLRQAKVGPGVKVGIVGIGGLGHLGIKLARAMGAHVVGLTTSEHKKNDILQLGAHEVIIWKNPLELEKHAASFDLIIDTVSSNHDLDMFMGLLALHGNLTLVGVPEEPHKLPSAWTLIEKRRSIAGSLIGGIAETQEMLDFCAEHGIVSEIEIIRPSEISSSFGRMERGDVRYRFVVDIAGMTADHR